MIIVKMNFKSKNNLYLKERFNTEEEANDFIQKELEGIPEKQIEIYETNIRLI